MGPSTFVSAFFLTLQLVASPSLAAPSPDVGQAAANATGLNWWMADIRRQGRAAYAAPDYVVFRNVKDYGAKGDGSTDDTEAINRAISDGNRCGKGCDSSTTTPALVYFPPGTYSVSRPIVQYYYTQLVGDFVGMPTLRATPDFKGIAVIDSNPYVDGGKNWHTNQNNFFRQIRNFIVDLTHLPKETGTGIHWQVAQATSLQNIVFNMIQDKSPDNKQQGIFMENGSGGFMSDLTFNGGAMGAFLGNQQFMTRNLKFRNCNTAIFMNWNWLWTFHGVSIDNCGVGINMANGGDGAQTVGSIVLVDSTISNTPVGVITAYRPDQVGTNGTLVLDNVDTRTNVPVAVQDENKRTILPGNTLIQSWAQGRSYKGPTGEARQGERSAAPRPAGLLDSTGRYVTRSKPQYEDVAAGKFISVKSQGAKGDGTTDDTAAIQKVFDMVRPDQIVYFDHGAYLITDTVRVPKNVKVVGELWPLIIAGGCKNFLDESNPRPVFQVGKSGDVGNVEMQDLIFQTRGPQPGAILMEFNVAGESVGSAALWDVHFRVGGSAGTRLQSDKCSKQPEKVGPPNRECMGAFLLVHVTAGASPYFENTWLWVADHELDRPDHNQLSIYNGGGLLVDKAVRVVLVAVFVEHNQKYNIQFVGVREAVVMLFQTETAYMQGNPDARQPFKANSRFSDPDFTQCTGPKCARTVALRFVDSTDVRVFGVGSYSFFDNYAQTCVGLNNCQDRIIHVENSKVEMCGVSTKASVEMVTLNGQAAALDSHNRNNFCGTISDFSSY
ncbi:glucan 1,3-beta-glucosidase GLUC78 precursor [Metarhizium album ARSEF 1941]|uniref:Glucan 1,3-beta-glucosidase GLUC78 n=1 Tax=Metarhizium album (strain ARSEF 1941) TaxID=1081103 RepID=A0A0B2WSS6_METAS|nr:glucan 1,3-beta-glucosidase GLUC78 precursor [Metarhizium album ARSEF 1941]KHN97088.1 glucan 1,3-beta-glucosidase GLUC78 precursor [Metarhizium album ARSEF 1941]